MKDFEQRYLTSEIALEERASTDGKSVTITGKALVFNQLSEDLGGFRELNDPACLDDCDMEDVIAVFNHEQEKLLGRTKSGTLKLEKRTDGLYYAIDVDTKTSIGNDVACWVRRKDITGSSYRFMVESDDWKVADDGTVVRTVLKIKALKDVSPVIFPAYSQASAEIRSKAEGLVKKEVQTIEGVSPINLKLKHILSLKR